MNYLILQNSVWNMTMTFRCKDKKIRKAEVVTKTRFLSWVFFNSHKTNFSKTSKPCQVWLFKCCLKKEVWRGNLKNHIKRVFQAVQVSQAVDFGLWFFTTMFFDCSWPCHQQLKNIVKKPAETYVFKPNLRFVLDLLMTWFLIYL